MNKKSIIGLVMLLCFYGIITIFLEKCAENKQNKIEYKGVLVDIFLDENNRNQFTYKIKTDRSTINQTVSPYKESLNYIEIGDSIIKERGKLQITVKKKTSNFNRFAIFIFEN